MPKGKSKKTKIIKPKRIIQPKNPVFLRLNKILVRFEGSFLAKNKILIIGAIIFGLLLYLSSRYLVVAWVDGKPITKIELYKNIEKRYGKDTREQIIVEKLILSEAAKNKVVVGKEEIGAEMKRIESEQGGAESLSQILEIQGISKEEFESLVRLQLLRLKIFGKDISITDEEVNKYLEDNKNQYKEVTDKVKEEVKELLKQQKINTSFNNWLKENLKGTRVQRVE